MLYVYMTAVKYLLVDPSTDLGNKLKELCHVRLPDNYLYFTIHDMMFYDSEFNAYIFSERIGGEVFDRVNTGRHIEDITPTASLRNPTGALFCDLDYTKMCVVVALSDSNFMLFYASGSSLVLQRTFSVQRAVELVNVVMEGFRMRGIHKFIRLSH